MSLACPSFLPLRLLSPHLCVGAMLLSTKTKMHEWSPFIKADSRSHKILCKDKSWVTFAHLQHFILGEKQRKTEKSRRKQC